MKHLYILALCIMQTALCLAQPSAVKNAAKGIFSIHTTTVAGKTHTANAVAINTNEVLCLWSVVKDATEGQVLDTKGKPYPIESIVAFNEIYDICKIRVEGTLPSQTRLTSSPLTEGGSAWITSGGKKPLFTEIKATKIESFCDSLSYYIFSGDALHTEAGQAILDTNGNLLGFTQLGGTPLSIRTTDMRQVASQYTDGLTLGKVSSASIAIPMDMPRDTNQARLFLIMAAQQPRERYTLYADRFTQAFPNLTDGYVAKANCMVFDSLYVKADETMAQAVENAANKAAAEYEWSHLIHNYLLTSQTDSLTTYWTFDNAIEHAKKAIAIDDAPMYKHLLADIYYSQANVEEALKIYTELQQTELRGSELFKTIALCKLSLNAPLTEVYEQLDSAVAVAPHPLTQNSAPYVLARGNILYEMEEPRKALADYNLYDSLMVNNASAEFYYTRHECELKLRQYQPALNDLAHAAYLSPQDPTYLGTLASLQMRLNLINEAIRTTDIGIQAFPDYSVMYLVKGLCLIKQEKKEEGMENLVKAQQLGNEQAAAMIEKYK